MINNRLINILQNKNNNEGTFHTATEIANQPKLWKEVFEVIEGQKDSINTFLNPLLKLNDLRIILTGAGSSAFIGQSVQGLIQEETNRNTAAIATTDLITHPQSYFLKEVPTLMVSFARSGNSPESVEAVNLANKYCDQIFHFIITCNKDGLLAKSSCTDNAYNLILPEDSNDKGLAMTGSFTSMLLSIISVVKLHKIASLHTSLKSLEESANLLLDQYLSPLNDIVIKDFERVIFLGSGPLLGIARECQLKLQELTDGQVICKYDSFLGFRHGPRAVANEKTLIVYLFSKDDNVFRYEKDLAVSIDADTMKIPTISFGRKIPNLSSSLLDIEFADEANSSNELYFIAATLLGQIMGFFKSVALGLRPDNPSVGGVISRVVQGVTIYPNETVCR